MSDRNRPLLRRAGRQLAVALALGIGLGAWQECAHQHGVGSAPGRVATWISLPLVVMVSGVGDWLASTTRAIIRAPRLEQDNRRLQARIARLNRERAERQELRAENQRLRALLGLARTRKQQGEHSVVAQVIGREQGPWLRSLMINRGRADSVQAGQVVISSAGVVGQIESAAGHSAVIAPITSRVGAVSAILQVSRRMGLVVGDGYRGCLFQPLDVSARLPQDGQNVLTSGMGEVYPKGLLLGKVPWKKGHPFTLTRWIRVEPAVDFNRLEEVLVIGSTKEGRQ